MEETTLEDARYQFEVNLFGLARLTQAVLPHMREQGAGTIVNISSEGGKVYTPLGAWYHATKHALEGWSDALRLEVRPFGIDVVINEPGIIRTEFAEVLHGALVERGSDGPYAALVAKVAEASSGAYENGRGSPPSVVADVIARALKARRPKPRYVAAGWRGRCCSSGNGSGTASSIAS